MSSGFCITCPAGYYCIIETTTPTICPAGSYCPSGTAADTDNKCPAGTYSGTKTGSRLLSDCLPCTIGHYCIEGTTTPTPAQAGYYIPYMSAASINAEQACPPGYPCAGTGNYDYKGFICDKGYYCPSGTTVSNENPCPAGTYSDRTDLWDESQCTVCPSTFYCVAASTLTDLVTCPQGYYCPVGTESSTHYPCPTGTFGLTAGLKSDTECSNCTAGGSCGSGSSSTTTCDPGYYCPAGTTTSTPTEYMAPAGSYISASGAASEYENTPCGYGNYCPTGATGATVCLAGTYADELRLSACKTWPAGYECPTTTMQNPTACAIGTYSIAGQTGCTTCPEGYYCYQTATSQVTMLTQTCPAGTICSDGGGNGITVSPNTNDHACPIGKYCLGGYQSVDWPAGTYNPIEGRRTLSECLETPAGYYTSAGATEYLTTPCSAGYYCLAGSTTATEWPCPIGTYRGFTGGRQPEDCAVCKSGYVCAAVATVTPVDCGAGNYCPIGTVIQELCPIGTYSAAVNNADSRSCTKCPTGHYCGTKGMTAVTTSDYCDSGFYCIEGATRPDPTDGITGKICPAGGFWLAGTTTVSDCPIGEYNPVEGAKNTTFCITCLPGQYCAGSANPTPTGYCDAGYYCPAGSTVQTQNSVAAGYYAPSGSDIAIPWARGTYQPSNIQGSCISCEAGAYWPDVAMTGTDPCPIGYYCESETTQTAATKYYDSTPCPVGTYNGQLSMTSLDNCTLCTAGQYCSKEALDAPEGDCDAGFYCLIGSPFQNPAFDDGSSNYGRCPMGSHCIAATSVPTECAIGKYSAMTKLVDNTYCKSCEPGFYCETAGISAPTDLCTPGYYCEVGSTSAINADCTANNFCPQGSANEEVCPVGFYNTAIKQGSCTECEAGYTCFNGGRADCPAGAYCP
jgi:hypothetical protein